MKTCPFQNVLSSTSLLLGFPSHHGPVTSVCAVALTTTRSLQRVQPWTIFRPFSRCHFCDNGRGRFNGPPFQNVLSSTSAKIIKNRLVLKASTAVEALTMTCYSLSRRGWPDFSLRVVSRGPLGSGTDIIIL